MDNVYFIHYYPSSDERFHHLKTEIASKELPGPYNIVRQPFHAELLQKGFLLLYKQNNFIGSQLYDQNKEAAIAVQPTQGGSHSCIQQQLLLLLTVQIYMWFLQEVICSLNWWQDLLYRPLSVGCCFAEEGLLFFICLGHSLSLCWAAFLCGGLQTNMWGPCHPRVGLRL